VNGSKKYSTLKAGCILKQNDVKYKGKAIRLRKNRESGRSSFFSEIFKRELY
jgi:hypothetical protein